jgi:hypothetical protein
MEVRKINRLILQDLKRQSHLRLCLLLIHPPYSMLNREKELCTAAILSGASNGSAFSLVISSQAGIEPDGSFSQIFIG